LSEGNMVSLVIPKCLGTQQETILIPLLFAFYQTLIFFEIVTYQLEH
jgi:hypothetical protein